MQEDSVNALFDSLSKSKFRSSFHLKDKDKEYVNSKGFEVIREHAYDFVRKRLASKVILNDGKQTPTYGHPIFIGQHATATCCRTCLYKWHHIGMNRDLSQSEIDYIVDVLMTWINKEINL